MVNEFLESVFWVLCLFGFVAVFVFIPSLYFSFRECDQYGIDYDVVSEMRGSFWVQGLKCYVLMEDNSWALVKDVDWHVNKKPMNRSMLVGIR